MLSSYDNKNDRPDRLINVTGTEKTKKKGHKFTLHLSIRLTDIIGGLLVRIIAGFLAQASFIAQWSCTL